MPRNPKKDSSDARDAKKDSRGPFKPARIKKVLAVEAERAADELAQDFTQWVNDAVRMRLEKEGRWPPKAGDTG